MTLKFDLHVHTLSRGLVCVNEVQLKKTLLARGIDGIAVTNFFDIEHALWLKEKLKDHVIIAGQEVWTRDGHVIGLDLKRRVRDLQPAAETVAEIHAQGGIAVAAHPFMFHGLGNKAIDVGVDAIEVYNGLIGSLLIFNIMAGRLAARYKLPRLASGDTSSADHIGWNQTHVEADDEPGVIEAIRRGQTKIVTRPLPLPWMFAVRNLRGDAHVKPWPVHATPCLVCGESWVLRNKKYDRTCMRCGRVEMSPIGCCQEHYYCVPCLSAVGYERALALRQQEYLS